MLIYRISTLMVALAVLSCAAFADVDSTDKRKSAVGFRLPTTDGKVVEVSKGTTSRLTVVCFLGTECPLAKLYAPRLAGLANDFQSKGVHFIGINSNRQDSMEDVREYVSRHGMKFPFAKDYSNVIADQYGAKRTPEVFVVDQNLSIRYRGRIDDQYQPGIARPNPTRHDLRIALEELLAEKPVSRPVTEPSGCLIGRVKKPRADSDITFCRQISRILQKHCVECHRPGEIGPFSLTDYDEVIGWADMMLEVIDDGRMPPWHASPEHGQFANTRFMSESDKRTLREWVTAGSPYGNANELPKPPKFMDGWLLPHQPDLVLAMRDRPFVVPAQGTVEYQYFVVDPGFTEDKWVRAAQVIPGNRSVVHHCLVFIRPPDGSRFRGVGWLTAYVPGQRAFTLPPGRARHVPAGSKFVFQMHYTPTGTLQKDLSRVGIVFGKHEDVTHEVYTLLAIDQEFEIPPHAADFAVEARVPWLPDNGELLAISPHMHLRGQSFRLFTRKDSRKDILLDVPRYDFNWQHTYQLANPLPLSSIDALEFTVKFDNSDKNPVNPDPSQHVTWGDQTWEEMAVAFFEVSEPLARKSGPRPRVSAAIDEPTETTKKIDDLVNRFMKRFDANKDGQVERSETPFSFRAFGFWRFDGDGDRRLTRTEVRQAARQRLSR